MSGAIRPEQALPSARAVAVPGFTGKPAGAAEPDGPAEDEARLRAALSEAGLDPKPLLALAQPALTLIPADGPRRSMLGGRPHLAAGTQWPRRDDGRPLSHLASFDLAELNPSAELGLPRQGTLSFFYDYATQPWGFDPADRDGFAVLYTPATETTSELEPPAVLEPENCFDAEPVDARLTSLRPCVVHPAVRLSRPAAARLSRPSPALLGRAAARRVEGGRPPPRTSPALHRAQRSDSRAK